MIRNITKELVYKKCSLQCACIYRQLHVLIRKWTGPNHVETTSQLLLQKSTKAKRRHYCERKNDKTNENIVERSDSSQNRGIYENSAEKNDISLQLSTQDNSVEKSKSSLDLGTYENSVEKSDGSFKHGTEKSPRIVSHKLLKHAEICELLSSTEETDKGNERLVPDEQCKVWVAAVKELCNKAGLSDQEFHNMYIKAPYLKQTDVVRHVSQVVDVMKEHNFGPVVKIFLKLNTTRVVMINAQHLRSILEDKDKGNISDKSDNDLGPSNEKLFEIAVNFKSEKYLGLTRIHMLRTVFPWKQLFDDYKSYTSIAEILIDELGIDRRVANALYHKKYSEASIISHKGRVLFLQSEGVTTLEILENLNLIPFYDNKTFIEIIEEQLHSSGKVDLATLKFEYKYGWILSNLLKTSNRSVGKNKVVFLNSLSRVNAAVVFFLLTDEGFKLEEIRKYLYILGAQEKEVREYLTDNKEDISLSDQSEREAFLNQMELTLCHEFLPSFRTPAKRPKCS